MRKLLIEQFDFDLYLNIYIHNTTIIYPEDFNNQGIEYIGTYICIPTLIKIGHELI